MLFREGQVVSLPFHENEKFVVGTARSGGMGSVFQLIPVVPIKRLLALKIYHEKTDRAQFEREARIWISLGKHPNIAEAVQYGLIEARPCILAVWHQRTLPDVSPKQLNREQLYSFVLGVIAGLHHANRRARVVHRDIKPSNVLVDDAGNPKVSDFGISIQRRDESPSALANPLSGLSLGATTKSLSGTPRYMAPELFRGAKSSSQTDIYSLGITLHEWLLGTHPYVNSAGKMQPRPTRSIADEVTRSYGHRYIELANLVAASCEIEASIRPSGYEQLTALLSPIRANRNASDSEKRASVFDNVAAARVLRDQGDVTQAEALLVKTLKDHRDDAVLLNAYGGCLLVRGKRAEALRSFAQAVDVLRSKGCRYDGKPYPDPYLNLANFRRQAGEFDSAADLISETEKHLVGVFELIVREAWEFAWLRLYRGNPHEAARRLKLYFSTKGISEEALAVLCLAAFVSKETGGCVQECLDLILEGRPATATECQYLCLLGGYLNRSQLYKLQEKFLTPKIVSALRKMSIKLCGHAHLFDVPMSPEDQRAILRGIDAEYTGGKYDEVV